MNPTLLLGALFGLTAVAAGAYANHGIENPADIPKVISAVRLQQIHALAVVAIGLSLYANLPANLAKTLKISAGLFLAGILLFSGNIYLSYFANIKGTGFLVPFGGMTIMAGWVALIWTAVRHKPSKQP